MRTAEREAADIAVDDEVDTVITLNDDQLSAHWEAWYDEGDERYHVSGEKIEKFARRTNYDQFEAVNRLRDIMNRLGISHELTRLGAAGDSLVQIGDSTPFSLVEQ